MNEIEGKLMKCKKCRAEMFVIESPGFHTAQCPTCGQEFQIGTGHRRWWETTKMPPLIYPIPDVRIPDVRMSDEIEAKRKRGKWEAVKV